MGWLRLVGSLKLKGFFAKEPYKRDDILQKSPENLRSLLIVATPYLCIDIINRWRDPCIYIMNRCASINARMTSTYIDGPRFTRTHRLQTIVCASCHPYEYIQEKTKKRGIFALHLSNVCECAIVSMHSFALSIDECDKKKKPKKSRRSQWNKKERWQRSLLSHDMCSRTNCVIWISRTPSFKCHKLYRPNISFALISWFVNFHELCHLNITTSSI